LLADLGRSSGFLTALSFNSILVGGCRQSIRRTSQYKEVMSKQHLLLTRRGLLKSGLAATATAAVSGNAFAGPTESKSHPAVPGNPSAKMDASVVSMRERMSLDFNWRFHLGDACDPAKDFGFGKIAREAVFAKAGRVGSAAGMKFDDSAWRSVDLPHDWGVELPFLGTPLLISEHGAKPLGREFPETSIGWYRRTFTLDAADAGKRISIEFDGVFRDTKVFFNGFYLGSNFSGYAPFSFDVTDFCNPGAKNVLALRVDASLSESWYYEGAGIYRHVWMVKTAATHIAQWSHSVRSEVKEHSAAIEVSAEIQNESDKSETCHLVTRIVDPHGKTVATASSVGVEVPAFGRHSFTAKTRIMQPLLWSVDPESAKHLYRAITSVHASDSVVDSEETTFGIRTLRWDANDGFFLNGKPLKIQGTCCHQDHAGVGTAMPNRIQEYRIQRLREMGSNAYRTAHNPPSPELLDACDAAGMMVMCETRMFSSSPEGFSELERMVMRFRNHPSVILWSIGNEEPEQGSPRGQKIAEAMRQRVRELDPTRLVILPMNGSWGKGASYSIDVQGFNYFNGNMDEFHKDFPHQPCVGSEIGSVHSTRGIYVNDMALGYYSAYDLNHNSYSSTAEGWWTYFEARPWLAGGFVWAGFDYRGEPKPHTFPSNSCNSGILDMCGFPKDNFYYYSAWWNQEPLLHLFPHWNWEGKEGQEIDVWCHSNLDSVELFVNGVSSGTQRIARNSHVTWKVKYAPGVIEARGTKDGRVVLTEKRETTGAAVGIRLRSDRATISADAVDVSMVTMEIVDEQGRIMPTASNLVEFTVQGPAKLIGLGNGDPRCIELDKESKRSAFNGLCMAIVQAGREPGSITISATSHGLEHAAITLQSAEAALKPFVE
jgi:beta-galactosidase